MSAFHQGKDVFRGVWSATPSPFTESFDIDHESVERLVEHHVKLGVKGLFLCGSCGEGPWLTDSMRVEVVRCAASASAGRLVLAAQVTDNSALRVLDNIERVAEAGVDIAVVAPPYFIRNTSTESFTEFYRKVVRQSALPVGIYNLGERIDTVVPKESLAPVLAEPNVVVLKDSSVDSGYMQMALNAREYHPELALMNGNEWDCLTCLEAGYDGLMLGGGIFNGALANALMHALKAGDHDRAVRMQERMNRLHNAVYGGAGAPIWLGGLKTLLVEMGLFKTTANLLGYSVTDEQTQKIVEVLKEEETAVVDGIVNSA